MIQSYDSPGTELFKKLLIHETIVSTASEMSRFEVHMKNKSFRMESGDFFFFIIFIFVSEQT